MGGPIPFRRRRWRRPPLPPEWAPYLRSRWPSLAHFRLTLWSGLLLGLLMFQAMRFWSAPSASFQPVPAPPSHEAPDPYAEARRSRAILDAQEGAPQSAPAEGGPTPARLANAVRIIDGDTFVSGGVTIRIADIDTPEIAGRCPHESRLAARATQRLRELLGAGPFELRPSPDGRDQDPYGRKLRIVARGGRSLGDVLVAEGLARTWVGRREPWCA